MIEAGIARMEGFFKSGSFCLWEGSEPNVPTTISVLKNLTSLYRLPFPRGQELIQQAMKVLKEKRVRDNQLLLLDRAFRADMKTVEDAAFLALARVGEKERQEGLKFLRDHAHSSDGMVWWEGKKCWGGKLEATCLALRALRAAGGDGEFSELFDSGFRFVSSNLVDGRLYSTADTRALVELLSEMQSTHHPRVKVDGKVVEVTEPMVVTRLQALDGDVLVRLDRKEVVNYLEPRGDFAFEIGIAQPQLALGARTQIAIVPKEETIAPLVRLYLPGCLALLKGGVNAQSLYAPIPHGRLSVDVVGVRRGQGFVRAMMHDMYDPAKQGVVPPLEVSVE